MDLRKRDLLAVGLGIKDGAMVLSSTAKVAEIGREFTKKKMPV